MRILNIVKRAKLFELTSINFDNDGNASNATPLGIYTETREQAVIVRDMLAKASDINEMLNKSAGSKDNARQEK